MFKSTKKTKDPTKSSNTKNLKVSENNIMTERDSVEQKQLFSSKVANEQPTNLSGKGRSSTPQTSKKTLVKSIASKQESETKSSSIERLSSSSSTTTTAVSGKTIKTTTTVDKDGNIRTHVETVEDLPKKTTNTTGDKLSTINLSTQSSGGQVNLFGSSMNNTDVSQKVFSETRHNSSIIGDETSSTLSLNSLKLPNTAKDITQNDDFYSVKLVNGKIIKSLNTKNDISDGLLLNKKSNKETHIKESEKSTSKIINEPLVQQKRISQLEESEVQIKSDDIKSNTENSKIKSHDKLFTNNNITISSDNSQPNQSNKNLSTLKSVSNKMDNNSLNVSNFVASAQSSYTSSKKETQKSDFLTLRNSKTLSMKNEQSLPKIQTTSSSSTEVEQIDTDRLSVRMIGGKLIKEFKEPASVTKTKSNFNNKSLSSDFNTFTTNEQSSFSNVEETSESSSISSKVSQNIKNAKFDKNDKSKTKSKVITENTSLTTNDNTKVGGLNIRMVGDKLIEDFKDIKPSSNKKSLPNNFSTTLKTSEQSSISNTIKGTNELSSMSSKTSQYINNSNFDKKDKFLCNKESKENTENIFSAKSTEKEGLTVRMVGGKLIKSFKEPTNQKIVKSNTNIDTTILSNNINTIVTNEKSYFSSSKEENEMSNSITSKISNSMDKIPFDKKKEPKTQTKNLLLNSTISLVNLDDENLSVENTFSTTNESTEKETVRMVGGELMKSFKEPSNRVRTTYNVSDSAHSLNDTSLYSTSSTLHAQSTKIADIQISSASKDTLIKDDQPNASNEKDFKNQSRPQVKPRKINKEPADFSNDITDNIVHSQIYDASQNTFVQSHTFSDESVVQGFHFTSKSSEFFSDSPTINHNLIDTTVVQDVTNIVSDTNIAEVLDSRVVLENVLKKSTISKLEQNLENRSTSEYTARENKSNTGSKKKQKETTTVTKEQCICEICTCGRHRCSHTPGTDGPLLSLESSTIPKLSTTKEEYQPIPLDLIDRPTLHRLNTELTLNEGIIENKTAYRTEFDKKHAERQLRYKLIDQIHLEGDYLPKKHQDFPGVPGDRFLPYKPQDNLKPEGEFERPIRPKVETVERPKLIKPNDNLKPEGDFNRPIPTKVQSADRPLPIKPKDNLRPEGQFDRPLKPQYGPGERAPIVKHPDNLKPEGEFEKPSPSIYAPGDRAPIKKHSDNLKPEGVFYGERAITIVAKGERAEIRRHEDQLVIGGEFTDLTTQKVEFTGEASERPRMIRRNTWTKLEGEILMSPKNKEEYPKQPIIKIEKGKKKNDTLNITSGEFYTNTSSQEAYQRHNITKTNIIKKCSDNLVCEGQMNFETSISSEFTPKSTNIEKPVRRRTWTKQDGEIFFQTTTSEIFKKHNKYDIRQEIIKHTDNLKMEGMMNNTTHSKEQYKNVKAEIPNRIKPKDNLRSEGDFERPTKEQYRSAERPKQIKPRNNLKLEGDFQKPQTKIAPKTDKRKLIKPKDTLKPEGDFQRPQPEEFQPAERPKQVKPQDNLYPEGKFERPELPEYSPAERPKQIKPFDNLKPEGEFERPVYEKFKPSERPTPFKPTDNLKPEGEFPQRIKETVGPGDRAPVVKPKDNLFPEGDFQRPQPEEFQPAERPKQVKPQDNLYPEGKFERPELPEYSPAERPKQIKPFDNLKPEGEFERPVYEKFKPSERPTPFKPTDNLKPEGEFPQRIKETVGPGDRAPVVKPKDNLDIVGEHYMCRKDDYDFKRVEHQKIIRRSDNLSLDGELIDMNRRMDYSFKHGERRNLVHHSDNLKIEGKFVDMNYKNDFVQHNIKQEVNVIKHHDNLKLEGKFAKRFVQEVVSGERAPVVKPKDNLKPEGDFERPSRNGYSPAERPKQVRHPDNLKPEGDFAKRVPEKVGPGERAPVVKPKDNLKPEGDFERPSRNGYSPAERPKQVRHPDNLKPEGDFAKRVPEKVGPGERAPIVKPKDNLKPEGDFERPSRNGYSPAERPKQVRHPDNLKPEGDFAKRVPEKVGPGERAPIVKPKDNLKPEGDFERPSRNGYSPAERPKQVRHPDNLKPEGDFAKRVPEKVGPGERAPIVKPKDNLKPEGDFERPSRNGYSPAERPKQVRHLDNLKLEGEFERRVVQNVKCVERPHVIKPLDNLRMEGDFVKRENMYSTRKLEQAIIRKHVDNLKLEGNMHYEHKNIHAESKINQIQLSNSQQNIHSSRIEAAANTLVNNQQIINSSLHGRSQILSDLKNDSNTSHNRLVKQDHTKFGVDNLEFKQSSDMSFRKSLKSDEHNEKVERKKWETTQKRDYLRSSVNNLDLSGKITSSKQYTHKIGDNRYAEDTTNHHFYHSHHQATQSHTQKSTRLINEQASSSKNESDATTQIRNNDLEKSKYTLKKNTEQSNKQSRLYDISSTQNSALSTQQNSSSSLDNISQQSQVESNLNASVSQISNNKSPIRRPESFVIDLKSDLRSDLKSQNDRFMSISRISKESTQDQINRQIFKSESNDENKNKGTKTYEYNTNDYQLSTADGLLNKNYLNHSHTDSRESMYDSNISHKKSSHTSKQTNEIKNYSTATYRKSLHSTTSNVLNLDTVVMDRKNYSDESHHRKSVISSNTDLSNSVLHRKGDVTIIEAPHTTSTAAAAQRKSINTLDSGFVSIAQDNRNSLSSMHRHERVTKSSNRSHITLGDTSITSNISHYKNEYKPRVTGPCPVPLIERNQAPFKHTRDTKSHKFYKYTSTTEGDRK
ncbi:uncharacterized protein LOC126904895 isoform X49 [Daktulosphaira vitifoliae]|uniref:uncharacterized protein LOC126904895 isoform X49 n=1 Tax=Daktulosphaira vitifoliae TaxID=58002 RepID=UPI0021AA53BA|nr:uncharacterized protein LOC126904895 isoform X49 [Daktulosphaira vitifoliae]